MSGKKSAQLHWSFLLHLLGGVDGGLYFINILSDLYYFFILLTLGFVLTLSIGRLRCLFEIFLVDLYCYKLPCESCFSISHGFWQVVFLFPFVLRYFLTSSLISSLIHWFFFLNSSIFFLFLAKNYMPEFAKDLLKYIQGIHVPIKFVPSRLQQMLGSIYGKRSPLQTQKWARAQKVT